MNEAESAVLVVNRTSQYVNHLGVISLFVDRERVAKIRDGETLHIGLKPGRHYVYARIAWCWTSTVTLDANSGDTINLACGSYLKGWKLLLFLPALFLPKCWIYLRLVGEHV